jgi:hypothetical protein
MKEIPTKTRRSVGLTRFLKEAGQDHKRQQTKAEFWFNIYLITSCVVLGGWGVGVAVSS